MRKFTFFLLAVFFLGATAFIIIRYKNKPGHGEQTYFPLLDRKGALANVPEWKRTHSSVQNYNVSVANNPKDFKSALSLAAIYIKEARISGNYGYYDIAALTQVNKVLDQEPENFEALTYKALIYLSQHHFQEGLDIAQKAQKINPYNAFIYGLLVDANVETGHYPEAVANAEKMISVRPDLSSYSRISYLREIHGDYPGAIEAMKLAISAGVPGDDATEWARVQLGHLYEATGKTDSAQYQYLQSSEYRQGYAPARAGLGNVACAEKNYSKAIAYYNEADTLSMDYAFKEKLATAYKYSGDLKQFNAISNDIIQSMSQESEVASKNENIGHYSDRELAYVYLSVNNNKKGLEHALAEYNRRPGNIDVNETVAWAYFKNNEYQKANKYIEAALITNCKNPVLLCRAGLIFNAAGDKKKAATFLKDGLRDKPAIDHDLKQEAETTLQSL